MKNKIRLFALLALMMGIFCSCNNTFERSFPILYVVNSTDYTVRVYCDNLPVATAGARNNSGAVELSDTSVNIPVYVETVFYDSKGNKIRSVSWSNYYFKWNSSYKMTINSSGATLQRII
ncbi:MAG: hypothetical protein IJ204_08585 [Paludibacteraceae bacterium]|nr:hypothetical protein [Paludibacteraceae bacterium]